MPSYALYWRFSTEDNRQRRTSPEKQIYFIEEYMLSNYKDVVQEISVGDAGISGDDDKPELNNLIKNVQEGDLVIDYLVVYDLARLTRREQLEIHKDLLWLKQENVKLIIVKTKDEVDLSDTRQVNKLQDKFNYNNEYVKDRAEDSVDGMLAKFKLKELSFFGPTPIGFDKKTKTKVSKLFKEEFEFNYLVPNEDLKHVRNIFNGFIKGESQGDLLVHLKKIKRYKTGTFNRNKNKIVKYNPTTNQIRQVLRNSLYCGWRTIGVRTVGKHSNLRKAKNKTPYNVNPFDYCADSHELDFEKAVSREKFLQVQKMLDKNKVNKAGSTRTRFKRKNKQIYPYTGLFVCGNCGGALIGETIKGKKETIVKYTCHYSKRNSDKCLTVPKCKSIREEEFNKLILFTVNAMVFDGGFNHKVINTITDDLKRRSSKYAGTLNKEILELELQEKRFDILVGEFQRDNLDSGKLKEMQRDIQDRKASIKDKLESNDSLVRYAEKCFEDAKGNEGFKRYFAVCYRIAGIVSKEDISVEEFFKSPKGNIFTWMLLNCFMSRFLSDASNKVLEERLAALNNPSVNVAELMGPVYVDVEWPDMDKVKALQENPATKIDLKAIAKKAMVQSGSDIVNSLKMLNLDKISVNWKLEKPFGRERWTANSLDLSFFSGDITYTRTGLSVVT